MVRFVLSVLAATSVLGAEAWMTMQANFRSRTPSSPPSRTNTRWDTHLDLAKVAYRRRRWGQVRQICSRVINYATASPAAVASHEWSAVEQAHLRLALAEQQEKRVDDARRTFQRGTAACPSSDTLFMAWALMESKIHNARSRKVARLLLRRAVSLNPKRHSNILKWRVFLEWREAGEAAVEAVCSAISSVQQTSSASCPAPQAPPARGSAAHDNASVDGAAASSETRPGGKENTAGNPSCGRSSKPLGQGLSAPVVPSYFVARWAMKSAASKERSLSAELLELCRATNDQGGGKVAGTARGVAGGSAARAAREGVASRLHEVVKLLEAKSRGVIGGSDGRVLSGSWRLAFSTCSVCQRVLAREGIDFFERLVAPIQEITPRPGEPPVPYRCEVLVTPSRLAASREGTGRALPVTHFLRGWAQTRVSRETGRVLLRQQVAPRKSARMYAGYRVGSIADPLPPPLPPAALRALGHVARGGEGLEKLVTQEVTYVGGRLRVGRSKDGDLFVYERCMWPRDQCS